MTVNYHLWTRHMKLKIQLIITLLVGAMLSGILVWKYLEDMTGEAALATLGTVPEEANQLVIIAESYAEGKTEIARKMTFVTLVSRYRILNDYIKTNGLPDPQLSRYTEARDRVENYLLKFPYAGCENIKKVEEFGYCYDE